MAWRVCHWTTKYLLGNQSSPPLQLISINSISNRSCQPKPKSAPTCKPSTRLLFPSNQARHQDSPLTIMYMKLWNTYQQTRLHTCQPTCILCTLYTYFIHIPTYLYKHTTPLLLIHPFSSNRKGHLNNPPFLRPFLTQAVNTTGRISHSPLSHSLLANHETKITTWFLNIQCIR